MEVSAHFAAPFVEFDTRLGGLQLLCLSVVQVAVQPTMYHLRSTFAYRYRPKGLG